MKLQLEFYQKVIMFTYLGVLLFILALLLRNNFLYISSIFLIVPGCLLGALVALTNVFKKEVVFKWSKVNTELHLPFMRNEPSFIATDNEGNKYKLNFLMIPKKIEKK